MEEFKNYLDKVKADQLLKDTTTVYVKNNYANQVLQNSNAEPGKGDFGMKRLMGAIASVAACLMLLVGGYSYYNKPVNYVSLDINPSVELGVNALNRVVSADGINGDGKALLEQNQVRNMSLESALQELVLGAAEQGYIAVDGSTVIALTALADSEDKGIQLRDQTRDRVQLLLQERDMDAVVYADCASLEIRTQAQQAGISPGKYRLIAYLQILDSSITAEQYRNAKITEIIDKGNELLQSGEKVEIQSPEWERTRTMIMAAGQAINQNRQMLQEQNRNQNQFQNGIQTQTGVLQDQQQIQSQTQTRNQLQDQTGSGQQNRAQGQYNNQIQTQTQTQTPVEQQSQNQTQSPDSPETQQNRVRQGN
ncbi:MAG: hypothetical protein ABRQ23_06505 [Syntrophomonadaceae bacterium]